MLHTIGRAQSSILMALFVLAAALFMTQMAAASMSERPGWTVIATPHSFSVLSERLDQAIKANKMGIVTTASASGGAKAQGFDIPGNRVVGVFRNDFARRMLKASIPAGIEAPIKFYLTENADGASTLSYKNPTAVFSPYSGEAGADLMKLAGELDVIFGRIARDAAKRD